MRTSTAGKALGPQSGQWETRQLDGETVIVTPGGRVLRLQQLSYGRWETSAFGKSDALFFAEAANLLLEKNAAEKAAAALAETGDL